MCISIAKTTTVYKNFVGECMVEDSDKVDCGYLGISQTECANAGCCWKESNASDVPYCFETIGESELSDIYKLPKALAIIFPDLCLGFYLAMYSTVSMHGCQTTNAHLRA